ncbi:MAG: hypothetical protein BWY99_02798 [Synergistetes bacterium ADurb.BinA166]|nr:MAG: hypothetical protein BWY99_02798 [Synergistetes bacterium ADurb.BinA166]
MVTSAPNSFFALSTNSSREKLLPAESTPTTAPEASLTGTPVRTERGMTVPGSMKVETSPFSAPAMFIWSSTESPLFPGS